MRHNLDIMHVAKNVGESVFGTMLHDNKSKDGINCRKDLEDWGIRHGLYAQLRGKKTYLPPAPYTLYNSEKKYSAKGCMILRDLMVIVLILKIPYHWTIVKLAASSHMIIMF